MSKGVCVQLGLEATCEYAYLVTESDWRNQIESGQELCHRIPEQVYRHVENWTYIGVDQDFVSISNRTQDYMRYDDIHFVCCNLHNNQSKDLAGDLVTIRSYDPICDWIDGRLHLVPSISFEKLYCGLEKILGVSHIDVLAVDIEGSELNLFNPYETPPFPWIIVSPQYIAVEIHNMNPDTSLLSLNSKKVRKWIEARDYTLIHSEDTNTDTPYPTREMQFLRG